MTSRKIVIAICTPCTVVSRSVLMSLIITFMFEPAKLQMNWARASGTSTLRKALDGRPVVTFSATLHLLTRRPGPPVQHGVEGDRGADQREGCEGLREVADLFPRDISSEYSATW